MQGIIALSSFFVNIFCAIGEGKIGKVKALLLIKNKLYIGLQIFLQFNVRHSLTNDFLCDIL